MPLLLLKSCLTPVSNDRDNALACVAEPHKDAVQSSSLPKKILFSFFRSSSSESSAFSNSNTEAKHTSRIGMLGDSSRALDGSLKAVNAEELILLEALREAIVTPASLQKLIGKTLTTHGDLGTRIRFVAAVGEYQRTKPPAEKLAKARKIVSMFIQNGAMFQLEGVPRDIQRRTSWKHYRDLELIRDQIELALVRDEVIREAIKKLFPELC